MHNFSIIRKYNLFIMKNKNILQYNIFAVSASFSLWFLLFMIYESQLNKYAAADGGAVIVNNVYAAGLMCTAGGFLLYTVLSGIEAFSRNEYLFLGIGSGVALALSFVMMFSENLYFIIASGFFVLLLTGINGGCVHSLIARKITDHQGMVIGLSSAAAICLQFIIQNLIESNVIFCSTLLIASLSLTLCYFRASYLCNEDSLPLTECEYASPIGMFNKKEFLLPIVAVALMSVVLSLNDSLMVLKNAENEVSLFVGIRLFYALGLIIAGCLADYKDGIYFNLATVCAMFLSTIAVVMLKSPVTYIENIAIMYLYSGFYVVYLTLSFIKVSVDAKCIAMSGAGRIVRSLISCIVVIMTAFITYEDISAITIISTLSCLLLLVLFALNGQLIYRAQEKSIQPLSWEERFNAFCSRYEFTERERQVFQLLITTEQSTQEMADALFISRRVLQRHISSIYEKTGTKTRIGLMNVFDAE